jgi:hypothetical protein
MPHLLFDNIQLNTIFAIFIISNNGERVKQTGKILDKSQSIGLHGFKYISVLVKISDNDIHTQIYNFSSTNFTDKTKAFILFGRKFKSLFTENTKLEDVYDYLPQEEETATSQFEFQSNTSSIYHSSMRKKIYLGQKNEKGPTLLGGRKSKKRKRTRSRKSF